MFSYTRKVNWGGIIGTTFGGLLIGGVLLIAVVLGSPDHRPTPSAQPIQPAIPQPSQSGLPYPGGFEPFIVLSVDAVETTTTAKLAKVTLSVTNTSREDVASPRDLTLLLYMSSDDKGANLADAQIAEIQPDVVLTGAGNQWVVPGLPAGATQTYVVMAQVPASSSGQPKICWVGIVWMKNGRHGWQKPADSTICTQITIK